MSVELLKQIVVKVSVSDGTNSISGSGVITKNREGKYFIITAEHCINGKSGARLNNIIRENITIQHKFNNGDNFKNIIVSDILFCDEKQDIAILSIAPLNGQSDNVIYSKLNNESDCNGINFRGFPKWLIEKDEAKTFDCKVDEVDSETFIIKSDEIKDLSLEKSTSETSSGLSGSGVFEIYNEKIFLIGIVTDLRVTNGTFGHIKCVKLDSIFDQYNFETSLLSNKEQQIKISIKAEDKTNFIGEIILDEYYIDRTLSEVSKKEVDYFEDNEEKSTLSKKLNEHKNLFVLGNPGGGKSTELKKLAILNWKEGEVDDYVPIFKSLKNFANTSTLEDYLPSSWLKLNKILLILDGIDEISDIESFKSKLENFIDANHLKKDIKYVISCRTNIYESVVNRLPNFSAFYLRDLTKAQGIELLSKKGIEFKYDSKWDVFLKNPFLVSILAEYISEKEETPISTAALWKAYIEKRLAHDKKDKLVKISIDPMLINKFSKKTSLISELMKTNVFDESKLFSILKENSTDFKEFKKNPLLEKIEGEDIWFFEHRNIQEYFAAKALSELSTKKIKKNILIKGTDKTHPTLFNTITFLINILEGEKYTELVEWFIEKEPELLFRADSNRIDVFKVKVFQYYFKTECIDKSLWISTKNTFSVKEIADFGNCEKNFNYLVDFVNDDKCHIRIVLSALKLLCFFEIPIGKENEIKIWCLDLLKNLDKEVSVKSNIIQFINIQKLIVNDSDYLNSIFDVLKEETNKEINSSLLFMIRDLDNIDSLFLYLKEEFLRVNKIVKRNDIDDVHRGNSWVLNELILKLNNSDFFIKLIAYHFTIGYNLDLSNDDAEKILQRCLFFNLKEGDFTVRFLTAINGKTEFYKHERLLKEIILQSNSQLEISNYLLENNPFSKVRVLLASIANTKVIELVKDWFVLKQISSEEINIFRHNLWVYNKAASYEFDLLMSSEGINFKFDTPLLSEEELSKQQIKNNSKFQHNFDILFNKDELLRAIEIIFKENNPVIDQNEIRKIESNWYEKNGSWSNTIDTSIKLLSTLVFYHYKETLSFLEVEEKLENDFIRYDKIKTLIKGNVNSNVKFEVSDEQKRNIIAWCVEASKSIEFDMIIKLDGVNSFSMLRDYEVLKTVLIFQDIYEFELSQGFLLNCLEFFDIEKTSEEDDVFEKLLARISDKKLFNQRIVNNILSKKMFSFVMDRHVSYALDHNLELAFTEIRNYFSNSSLGYNLDEKLEKYIQLTGDIALLKQCCEDVKSPKCWSAIKILLKLDKEVNFCITKAIEYLNINFEDSNKFCLWDALGVLFQQNRKEAIVYYHSLLNEDHLSRMYYSNYSAVDYDTFEKIFFETYKKDSGKSVFNDSAEFMSSYVTNLSKDAENYTKTQKVLNSIKNKLNKEEHDSELFYINILIDNSTMSYINSKSKPMKFEEALRKVEEIIN
ncbi:NACHT domain-containing protein [Flavobacterium sp. ZB4P13]|uniref:NACHT domain-containing protein n=1 Tax=Flavobacterium sp. ZB4P13 TaxID=3401728 RepID=UPI003AAE461B